MNKTIKKQHRNKAMPDEYQIRRNISLCKSLADKADRIGGDISKGIRKALIAYKE